MDKIQILNSTIWNAAELLKYEPDEAEVWRSARYVRRLTNSRGYMQQDLYAKQYLSGGKRCGKVTRPGVQTPWLSRDSQEVLTHTDEEHRAEARRGQ